MIKALREGSLIGVSSCKNGVVEYYLNQTCSSFDISLSPQVFSDLILIAFPPVPALDYTIYLGMDFNLNGEKITGMIYNEFTLSSNYFSILINGNLPLIRTAE